MIQHPSNCVLSINSFQVHLRQVSDSLENKVNFIIYVLYCLSHPELLKPEDTFHIYDAFKKLFSSCNYRDMKMLLGQKLNRFFSDNDMQVMNENFPIVQCTFLERKHYTFMAYAYLLCEGEKRSMKRSCKYLSEALQAHETSFAYFSRGRVAPSATEKIQDYLSSIRMDETHSIAYNNLALQFENALNKFDVALEYYNLAIKYHPYDYISYNNRALLHENRFNDRASALGDYESSIRLNELYSTAWNNRGVCYKRMQRYDLALADYERAIAIDSTYENAIQNREFLLTFLRRLSVIGNM
mmetsp:Transcript_4242/g.15997  ORF Transcript_4242/g.15997 Transcript_4242/m.15997 type:complete len:299 (-) Transcript_4242:239-1135(-)